LKVLLRGAVLLRRVVGVALVRRRRIGLGACFISATLVGLRRVVAIRGGDATRVGRAGGAASAGFALLTAILSVATVLGMIIFTWLTLSNLEKLNLRFLEKYESGIIGSLLCTLGVLIVVLEQ